MKGERRGCFILFFSKVGSEKASAMKSQITNVAKKINIDYHLSSRHGAFYCIFWFSALI